MYALMMPEMRMIYLLTLDVAYVTDPIQQFEISISNFAKFGFESHDPVMLLRSSNWMTSGTVLSSQTGNLIDLVTITTTDSVWAFNPGSSTLSYGLFSDDYKVAFVRMFDDLDTCPYIWIGGQMNQADAFMVKNFVFEN